MKKLLFTLAIVAACFFGSGGLVLAEADAGSGPGTPITTLPTDSAKQQVCEGINGQVGGTCDASSSGIDTILKAVLEIISVIAGIAAVIMIMVGGIKYTTSGGDSTKISSAKSTLIYALVGIVVVAMAQFIVQYVLAKAS